VGNGFHVLENVFFQDLHSWGKVATVTAQFGTVVVKIRTIVLKIWEKQGEYFPIVETVHQICGDVLNPG